MSDEFSKRLSEAQTRAQDAKTESRPGDRVKSPGIRITVERQLAPRLPQQTGNARMSFNSRRSSTRLAICAISLS